jgi:hypothetical protein
MILVNGQANVMCERYLINTRGDIKTCNVSLLVLVSIFPYLDDSLAAFFLRNGNIFQYCSLCIKLCRWLFLVTNADITNEDSELLGKGYYSLMSGLHLSVNLYFI